MQAHTITWSPADGWSAPFPGAVPGHTLVLAFGDSLLLDMDQPLAELNSAYAGCTVTGCSTAGQFAAVAKAGQPLLMRLDPAPLVVTVVTFDQVTIRSEAVLLEGRSSEEAGHWIAARWRPENSGIFVLCDGQIVNGDRFTAGLLDGLAELRPAGAPAVPVSGGLAGDGDRFERTWVLVDGRPVEGAIVAVYFEGPALQIGHGCVGGWSIFGPPRKVTSSDGNVLFELDGQPALDLYKQYLGDRAVGLPATALLFPLALHTDDGGEPVVRTVLSVDESSHSLTFAGDVPIGSTAQLMRATSERLVDAAAQAAVAATRTAAATPAASGSSVAIAVSCVGRRLALGERTEDELEAAFEELDPGTVLAGFYSYGEIAPARGGRTRLHNQTMTMTVFREQP